MPPCSWYTWSCWRAFRNAEAFSQRMPPVQYMMTFLSRSSSARFVRYRAISEYVSAPRSTAPRKCPMEYSFVFRMSRMTVYSLPEDRLNPYGIAAFPEANGTGGGVFWYSAVEV